MNRRWIALLSTTIASLAFAAGEIPDREEYAYRFGLNLQQSAEFVAARIPIEVYRSVSDPKLRDIGVYNGAGQAVPRMVEQLEEKVEPAERIHRLGIVPLYGELAESQDRIRLLLQKSKAGTTLELDSEFGEGETSRQALNAYIVDLRDMEWAPAALDLDWTGAEAGFMGKVTVEESNDLAIWRTLARGSVADLKFEGTDIEQARIELPRVPQDYLRLTWRGLPEGWKLLAINGVERERGPDSEREWLDLQPVETSEDGREFTFDVGGYPPIDRLNLVFSETNVVVRASVQVRVGDKGQWGHAYHGLFYEISRDGQKVISAPARIGVTRVSEWKVSVQSGSPGSSLKLRVGWRPERLLFLTQGDAPFELATGRSRDRLEDFPQETVLGDRGIFKLLLDGGEPGRAEILARREAAGAMVMEGARTWTWRTVLVWVGLMAAVVFVGWLVWSLMRENEG